MNVLSVILALVLGFIVGTDIDINSEVTAPVESVILESSVEHNDASSTLTSVLSGMVQIENIYENDTGERTCGLGSGVIFRRTEEGYLIVTNEHVVRDSVSLTVVFSNGERARASKCGNDGVIDLACIFVSSSSLQTDMPVLSIFEDIPVSVGESVYLIGNAFGHGQTVTSGIVSAFKTVPYYDTTASVNTADIIMTDAPINPGMSGGALIDASGRILGIAVSKSSSEGSENATYVIPSRKVRAVIHNLSLD